MNNLLEINNLIVSFENPLGELTAVKGVSLSIAKGETLALVGESGCGKTVLCKSMLRILCDRGRIHQGEILLEGKDLVSASEAEMRMLRGGQIAMVFQDPMVSLDPAFSVGEQIAEVLRIHKGLSKTDAKTQALELMELVQIPDARNRYGQRPYQFSGGMRQRIVIAAALAGEPSLLLADEPTTALDEETQEEILKLLKEIQRKTETAILFITHDLSLVEDIADRVAVMKDGKLVEQGRVDEVFSSPQHPYTCKLLGYLDYKKGKGHHHRGAGADRSAGNEPERSEAARETETPLLSVKNVEKTFALGRHGRIPVLQDFNMDVYRGEIVGLAGRSGCGKSTLARCIMGIEPLDGGQIEFADDINAQMIFQDAHSAFNDRMTVKEIIAEPLQIGRKHRGRQGGKRHGIGTKKRRLMDAAVSTAMKAVELDPVEFAERRPYELSGGQRQRIAIARALITKPDFIIADEPLTGLDVSAQAQIVHLFKKLAAERNLTILLIAHDLPMVNHISDRVIRMAPKGSMNQKDCITQ